MKISVQAEETGDYVLTLAGELVGSSAALLVESVNKLENINNKRLFLNMADVVFMDSSGLKICMQVQNSLRQSGSELACYNVAPRIHKIFEMTGADQKIVLIRNSSNQHEGGTASTGAANHFTMILAPIFEEVNFARRTAEIRCREFYQDKGADAAIDDFILAITEAMNNVVEHSRAHWLDVDFSAYADRIVFTVKNDGVRFDPTEDVSMPELDEDGLVEGGFGRAIINELMDEVRYDFVDNRNVLTLVKRVSSI